MKELNAGRKMRMLIACITVLMLLCAGIALAEEPVDISAAKPAWEYQSGACELLLTYHNGLLVQDTDYTAEFDDAANTVLITGIGEYTGSAVLDVPEVYDTLYYSSASGVFPAHEYTGAPITPVSEEGYTVQAWNNVHPGTAGARIIANGENGKRGVYNATFKIQSVEEVGLPGTTKMTVPVGTTLNVHFSDYYAVWSLKDSAGKVSFSGGSGMYSLNNDVNVKTETLAAGTYKLTYSLYTYSIEAIVMGGQYVQKYTRGTLKSSGTRTIVFENKATEVINSLTAAVPIPCGIDKLCLMAYPTKMTTHLAPEDIYWTTSDSSVAYVDTKGIVTIKGAGDATIKATASYRNEDYEAKWELSFAPLTISNAKLLSYNAAAKTAQVFYDGTILQQGTHYTLGRELVRDNVLKISITGRGMFDGTLVGYFFRDTGYPVSDDQDIETMPEVPAEFVVEDGVLTAYNAIDAEVVVPDGVVEIADGVFEGSVDITDIILPESVTRIGARAFADIPYLTTLTFGGSVTEISGDAFEGIADKVDVCIPNFECATAGQMQAFDINLCIGGNKKLVYRYMEHEGLGRLLTLTEAYSTTAVLPYGVQAIGDNAYAKNASVTLTLPESLIYISDIAFTQARSYGHRCERHGVAARLLGDKNLTYMDKNISGAWYLSRKDEEGIYRLYLDTCGSTCTEIRDGVYNVEDDVYGIRLGAFMGNTSVKEVYIPETVKVLEDRIFYNCTKLEKVVFPSVLDEISYYLFFGCTRLKEVYIPDTLSKVNKNAFSTALKRACICVNPDSIAARAVSAAGYSFRDISRMDYAYRWMNDENGEEILVLTTYAGDGEVTTLPDDVKHLAAAVFAGNTTLKTVILPASVESIESGAFTGCNNLESIIIHGDVATLPEDILVTDIYAGYEARLYLQPGSLTETAAADARLYFSHIGDEDWQYTYVADESGVMVKCISSYLGFETEVTVPDTVSRIGDWAFYYNNRIERVMIPETVRVIGNYAFNNCTALKSVEFPETLISIGTGAFANSALEGPMMLPAGITSVGANAFGDMMFLSDRESEVARALGFAGYCFSEPGRDELVLTYHPDEEGVPLLTLAGLKCEDTEYLIIEEGIEKLATGAIKNRQNLLGIVLPASLRSNDSECISACPKLNSITFKEGVEYLTEGMISECPSLVSVVLPRSLKEVSDVIFQDGIKIVYVYRDCAAAEWALGAGKQVVFLDDGITQDNVVISGSDELKIFVGEKVAIKDNYSAHPLPENGVPYRIMAESSDESVVRIEDGCIVAVGEGSTEVILTIEGSESAGLTVAVESNYFITNFDVPEYLFVLCGTRSYPLKATGHEPQAASAPAYTWTLNGSSVKTNPVYLNMSSIPSASTLSVKPQYGVTKSIQLVSYNNVDSVTFERTDSRRFVPGLPVPVQFVATLDGRRFVDPADAYTLESSDPEVIKVDEGGVLRALKAGKATITAKLLSGESVSEEIVIEAVRTMHMPGDLKEIRESAFAGAAMEAVIIPEGCVAVRAGAFRDCAELMVVIIPASVQEIADDAFDGCDGLIFVTEEDSVAWQYAEARGFDCVIH